MLDVALAVMVGYSAFLLLGLGVAYLLLGQPARLLATLCLAPVVGFALVCIVTLILVLCDFPVERWARLSLLTGGTGSLLLFGIAWRFSRRDREEAFDWRFLGLSASALACGGAFACWPILVGGSPFTSSRCNVWDAGCYIGQAEYLQTERFSDAGRYTPQELHEKHPVFPLRIDHGKHVERWLASATLAWLSSVSGVENYRLFMGQTVLCLLLSVGPVLWLARLGRIPPVAAWLLAVVIVVGFWAQIGQDIGALSQLNSLALLVAAACCLTHLEQPVSPRRWGTAALLALFAAALVLQYVEMVPFFIAGMLLWFALAIGHGRAWRWDLAAAVGAALATTAIVFFFYPPLFWFLYGQLRWSMCGNEMIVWGKMLFSGVYAMPLDGVPGLGTLAKHRGDVRWFRNLPTDLLGVFFWIAVVAGIGWQVLGRHRQRPVNRSIGAFSLVYALVAAGFYYKDSWWPAGKALAYGYQFLYCSSVFGAATLAAWLWRRRGIPRWLGSAVGILLVAYLGSQLLVGKQRVYWAKHWAADDFPTGIYNGFDVDATPFRSRHTPLPPDATCAVALAEPWPAEYYTNVMRKRMHVIFQSLWSGEARRFTTFNPCHGETLPDFVLVANRFADAMKSDGHRIVAANRDAALVDLRTADTHAPQLLWTWGPTPEEGRDSDLTILCIVAFADGMCELPTATILPPNLPERDRHYAVVSLFASSNQIEQVLGPLSELSDRLPIPVRQGINNVRLRVARPTSNKTAATITAR